jgi:hypothetical protein
VAFCYRKQFSRLFKVIIDFHDIRLRSKDNRVTIFMYQLSAQVPSDSQCI